MNVEKDSIYQTRYIRILGWCSCALGGCMFISGLAIHATPQYPDLYQNPAHIAYAYHGQFDNRKPSGQGFIGALLAWAHCLTSYFFSRPRKRNEMVWVSFSKEPIQPETFILSHQKQCTMAILHYVAWD